MLVVNTKEIFLLNLHQNRGHFPAERVAFVLDHQHGRRDVSCKQAIDRQTERYFTPLLENSEYKPWAAILSVDCSVHLFSGLFVGRACYMSEFFISNGLDLTMKTG